MEWTEKEWETGQAFRLFSLPRLMAAVLFCCPSHPTTTVMLNYVIMELKLLVEKGSRRWERKKLKWAHTAESKLEIWSSTSTSEMFAQWSRSSKANWKHALSGQFRRPGRRPAKLVLVFSSSFLDDHQLRGNMISQDTQRPSFHQQAVGLSN